MQKLKIYCVTNKIINYLDNTSYKIGWVGKEKPPNNYILCDSQNNIFYKEKYYSELTFHYWLWKNNLDLRDDSWIGFCQKRRFWIKEDSNQNEININNFKNHFLYEAPEKWKKFDAIICNPISVNTKKMKLIKRGFKSLLRDPMIFFNKKKHTLKLHFDMHHGFGNLDKAINLIEENDREEFRNYVNESLSFNPHIMFIAKPKIVDKWFSCLFPWLFKCEKIFGFKNLHGYDTERLYAFLAERYLSFWFKKHTNYLSWPWAFFENK